MNGYVPIDLKGLGDTAVAELPNPDAPSGSCSFHGLPFEIGELVSFDDQKPVEIPVGRDAKWIVIAHAIYETDLYAGGEIGRHVADYEFVAGREVIDSVPIRERLEIGVTTRHWPDRPLPLDWGQAPLLARPDAQHFLLPRAEGRYDQQGARLQGLDDPQTREPYVLPYTYFLWAWKNPGDLAVESIVVNGRGPRGFIAAVTASDLDEEPFDRSLSRDVVLRFGRPVKEEKITVEVDRGTANYPLWTVGEPTGTVGFGEAITGDPESLHVRMSGSPSATVTVKEDGEVLASLPWSEIGSTSVEGIELEPAADEWVWVRGRVVDAASGEDLHSRIHMRDEFGVPWAPHGHHAHINSDMGTWYVDVGGDLRMGRHSFAYIDGTFEGWLPVGEVTVEVACGFEYEPLSQKIAVTHESTSFVFELERAAKMADRRLVSGDTHLHFLSTQGAMLEGRGEGLGFVNPLATQWHDHFSSTEDLIGRPVISEDGATTVFTAQENRQNVLGHISLLGLRRPVMPWDTGGPEEAELGGGLEATLSHWADETHEQGGTVILAHFPCPYGEAPALIATGRVDAVETLAWDVYNLGEWYRYLNAGFRVPLVGGTDKMTSEVPLGLMRTYSRIAEGEETSFESWTDGIKSGDTFVTSGPLIDFSVDGETSGTTMTRQAGDKVRVRAEVSSIIPIRKLELIVDGEVRATIESAEPARGLSLDEEIEISADTWIAVRCGEFEPGRQDRHNDTWGRAVGAHASPVYVKTGGEYWKDDPAMRESMMALIDGCLDYLKQRVTLGDVGQVTHRHGESDHLAFLSRPFEEAREVLAARAERAVRNAGDGA